MDAAVGKLREDGHPQDVQRMLKELTAWRESVKASFAGKDYIR